MRTLDDHLFGAGPKRILALDGGGVRGLVTLGMLLTVERLLRERVSPEQRSSFRLCDYFDLIGGTSTGGLIASLLALGWDVERIIAAYSALAPKVFGKSRLLLGVKAKFDGAALDAAIHEILGGVLRDAGMDPKKVDDLRMDSDLLQTGLALVSKRIDKGSVWTLTNNPKSKYWVPHAPAWEEHFQALGRSQAFYPNSQYSLAKIVRASASAPFYLDGVEIEISPNERGHFLDGGVSPCNNPAQELFLMTTLKPLGPGWSREGVSPYGFNWATGADQLLIVSLGTGVWKTDWDASRFKGMWSAKQTMTALLSMIDDASLSGTTWLQALSEHPRASAINGHLEQMHGLRIVEEPLLSFRRISPRLEAVWLATLGPNFKYSPGEILKMRELDHSAKANLERLLAIGTETGTRHIIDADFPPAFDIDEMRPDWGALKPPPPVVTMAPEQAADTAVAVPPVPAATTPPPLPVAATVSSAPAPAAQPGERISIAFTGHRWDRLPAAQVDRIRAEIDAALATVEQEVPPAELVLLSGLAEGSDRLAAEAAGSRGWAIGAMLPFSKARYLKEFETTASRQEFETLLARCVVVEEAPTADGYRDPEHGYRQQGARMLAGASALITVWDGDTTPGRGATYDAVAAAKAKGLPVLWISTVKAGLQQI